MEGKWGFVNRHCDPADGEVVRLQVSCVPGFPGVPRSGEAVWAQWLLCTQWAVRPGSLMPGGYGLGTPRCTVFTWVSPFLSVWCWSAVRSKSRGRAGGGEGSQIPLSDPIIKGIVVCFFVRTHPPVGASKQIHQF